MVGYPSNQTRSREIEGEHWRFEIIYVIYNSYQPTVNSVRKEYINIQLTWCNRRLFV
jgi:hypothetical protein